MIGIDSVVALASGFVCADRLRTGANAFTELGTVKVTRIAPATLPHQVHVGTKHFSIITSPDQFFVTPDDDLIMASDLQEGDELFCSTGIEVVERVGVTFLDSYPMLEVATENGFLVSNGFHLFFGQWQ